MTNLQIIAGALLLLCSLCTPILLIIMIKAKELKQDNDEIIETHMGVNDNSDSMLFMQ